MFHIMEKEYGVTRLLDPEGKKNFEIFVWSTNLMDQQQAFYKKFK